MCTLSWDYQDGGYGLYFSRDEQLTRGTAEPPGMVTGSMNSCSYLCPRDPDKGGTWIAVNTRGVTHCLLNDYESSTDERQLPPHPISRGLLVLKVATFGGPQVFKQLADEIDHTCYEPFQLWQFTPEGSVTRLRWDGTEMALLNGSKQCWYPISGSSYRNDEVVAARCARFTEMVGRTEPGSPERMEALKRFHHSTADPGSHGVNMLRKDAQTVSLSRIEVGETDVAFTYQSKQEIGTEFGEPTCLRVGRIK